MNTIKIINKKAAPESITIRKACMIWNDQLFFYWSRQINCIVILIFLLGMVPREVIAQTGTIIGEVKDTDTGETLPGANVIIMGTIYGGATDIDGRYTLHRIPVGDHIIVVRFLGYISKEIPVTVIVDERIEINVELEGDYIEGDEVFVVSYQRGQARALTRQRESANIRTVISAEQMNRFADNTVDGALSRVAGVQDGNNIRGVGQAMHNVTVDGQRMGTTGAGDRSVDLSTISSDMVRELDVIKVITPDMDADAMSGVINISTRRPVGGERELNVRLGSGGLVPFYYYLGPSARASISYGESPTEDFSYAVNFSYQRDTRATESVQTDWEIRNLGEGPVDVLTNVRSRVAFDPRVRLGTGLQMTFQPTDRSTYHVQGMFNVQQREQKRYEFRVVIGDDYIDRYTTGRRGQMGQIRYESRLQEYNTQQYTFQAGARHRFDNFNLDYKLGGGHGRYKMDRYGFPFRTSSAFDYSVNIDNRWSPTVDIINEPGYPSPTRLFFDYMDNQWDEHIDNEFSGKLDLEIPHHRGAFKFGGSSLMTFKDGDHENHQMTFQQIIRIPDFDQVINADWNVFGRDHETYHIPWLIDPVKGKEFFFTSFPHFNPDLEHWAENSEVIKYKAREHTYAVYGMSTLKFGRLMFLGGLRVEHSRTRYDGREAVINSFGRYQGSVDTRDENEYTFLFPNAQLVFGLGIRTNLRLAYSRSIGRPAFRELSPYRLLDYDREVIRRGNPQLEPMLSNNLDLLFEHYFLGVGQFTVGFYYKDLTDFVFQLNRRIDEGEFTGWEERVYLNGEEATVYGVEVTWQQTFDFLPGFLRHFGTYANYSYSQSHADVGRNKRYPLPDQRPHIVNAGLDYTQRGFSGHVSYHWSAPAISSYFPQQWVPEIHLRERVYFDRYRDGANDVSLSLRYRLTSSIRIWADGSNLFNHRRIDYNYDRDFYPYEADFRGRMFNLGIHYSL